MKKPNTDKRRNNSRHWFSFIHANHQREPDVTRAIRLTERQRKIAQLERHGISDEHRKYHYAHKVHLKWWDWIKPLQVLPPMDTSIDEEIRDILKAY